MLTVKLAWRNLWRNRRRTLITLSSIGLGLAIAIIFGSMGAGTYKKLIDTATRMSAGHLALENPDHRRSLEPTASMSNASHLASVARSVEGVLSVKTLVAAQAIASTGVGSGGVSMIGVDAAVERETSPVAERIQQGRYLEPGDEKGAVIGSKLASRLKLGLGKKLVLTVTDKSGEISSELVRVVGIYSFGSEEVDVFLVHVPISLARKVLGMTADEATQVGVVLRHASLQPSVHAQLVERLRGENVKVWGWEDLLTEVSSFVSLDKKINGVLQSIILFLVSFTILNTILMSVLERSREFAMVLALGTSPRRIRMQIFSESVMLAGLGSLVGVVLGGAASFYFQRYGMDLSSFMDQTPNVAGFSLEPIIFFHVRAGHIGSLTAFVFANTLLVGLYPIWKSARVNVAQVLRSR